MTRALVLKVLPWLGLSMALLIARSAWRGEGQAELRAQESAVTLSAVQDSLSLVRRGQRGTLARVDTFWRERRIVIARVDTLRWRADSLLVLATDTGTICQPIRLAYVARTSECTALRLAVVSDSVTLGALTAQVTRDTLTLRAMAVSLGTVIKPYHCQLLWLLPCPSRGVMLVSGLLGGMLLRSQFK